MGNDVLVNHTLGKLFNLIVQLFIIIIDIKNFIIGKLEKLHIDKR